MSNRYGYLIIFLTLLISCSGPNLQGSQKVNTPLSDQIKTTYPSYQGPVELIIDPGMQTPSLQKPIAWTAKDDTNFSIKTSNTQPVFEKNYTLDETGALSFETNFETTETNKRYSIRLEYQDDNAQQLAQLNLTLNNQMLLEQAMLSQERFWQKDKIILSKQNSLNLSASGQPGLAFKVIIVQAEDAGTVFTRQAGTTILPQTFPEELKALRTNEGDKLIHSIPTSAISINQTTPMHFESGMLTVQFHDKEAGLELLKSKYKVRVDSTLEIDESTFYYLYPDLTTSPLQNAEKIIRDFNNQSPISIEQVRTSSLAALQLLLIRLEILTKHKDLVKSVGFNSINPHLSIANSEIAISDTSNELMHDDAFFGVGSSPSTPFGSSSDAKRIGRNWALRDSRVPEAWRYSMGTGVKVAWLDIGYGTPVSNPSNGVSYHPEVEDKRRLGTIDFIERENQEQTHAITSLMAGFAEKGNELGSAGTAPNAQVAMYNVSTAKQFAEAVKKAINSGIDVIGINQSWAYDWSKKPLTDDFIDLITAIDAALKKNIPVTMPAHNFGQTIVAGNARSTPIWPTGDAQDSRLKDLIIVAGVGINFDPSLGDVRSVQAPGPTKEQSGTVIRDNDFYGLPNNQNAGLIGWFDPIRTSNDDCKNTPWVPGCFPYGTGFDHINKTRLVWAPGQRVLHYDSIGIRSTSGTSIANPFITGVVALMKSRNPNLTPSQILSILRSNSFLKVRANPEMRLLGLNDEDSKMVDVASAVIRAIDPDTNANSSLNQNFQNTYKAKDWIGQIKNTGTHKYLITPNDILNGNPNGTKLQQSISNVAWNKLIDGKAILLTGWKGNGQIKIGKNAGNHTFLNNNEIEVLEYQDLTTQVPIIEDIKIFQRGKKAGKTGEGPVCSCADFVIQVKGKYFYHSPSKPLRIITRSNDISLNYLLSPELDKNREYINQDGTLVQFYIQTGRKDSNGNVFLKNISEDKVVFRVESSQNVSTVYPDESESNKIRFIRTNPEITNSPETIPPLPEKNFGTLSLGESQPTKENLPQGNNQYIYDRVGNRWLTSGTSLTVNANDFAGIRFNQPIRNLEVKIGPILVPIIDVLNDLAVIGIPEDLPVGVHDIVIKASGGTLTLEQVIQKASATIPIAPEISPPPSGNPGEYNSVRIYNLEGNDEGRVYLNDQLILTGYAGQDSSVSIGQYGDYPLRKDKRNEVRFELTNNGGGYTYGFELRGNSDVYYQDEKGTPNVKNVVKSDGSEDQSQGVVYNERMTINSKISPVGSGSYWLKVFNLNPDEALTIEANNEIDDIAWRPNGSFRVTGAMGNVSRSIPLIPIDVANNCANVLPWHEFWRYSWISLNFQNPQGPYSLGIEVYKGINLVYRNIQGQVGHWGAKDNEITDSVNIAPYVGREYCHFTGR